MTHRFWLPGMVLLALLLQAGSMLAQAALAGGTSLTAATVAAALAAQGFPVQASQLELPTALSTRAIEPQLHVRGADLLPDGRLRVRLSCEHMGDCQPFFATVRPGSAGGGLQGLAALQSHLAAPATQLPPAAASPQGVPASAPAGHLLAGTRATLLMGDARMRIALPVVAIDSGMPGTEVRVASLDRRQTFRAVVADASTVRGELP